MKTNQIIDFKEIRRLTLIDKKSLLERTLKLSEEAGEVSQAVLSSLNACGCDYKEKSKEDIVEECLDVIIVASSIISQSYDNEINMDEIIKIYKEKLKKWEEKCKTI